jgi:hypothetical protein
MKEGIDNGEAVVLKGTRDQIYSQISGNKDSEAFFLKTKPNVMMFVVLLNETKIKELYITEGIYRTIPQKVMKSLKKSVNLVVKKCRRGRPQKYSEEEIRGVLQGSGNNGEKMKKLGMPRRTFFYWKRKLGFSGKRRKRRK